MASAGQCLCHNLWESPEGLSRGKYADDARPPPKDATQKTTSSGKDPVGQGDPVKLLTSLLRRTQILSGKLLSLPKDPPLPLRP
ncbi:hypothetical protein L1987_24247 [Smallanthus sonchifolius]|uniref:Uncharacterized protein n=1 Tax=Smallanthus sonchifolius TaxID=185202 RepID=A0ACB9IJ57_9ASTR|nr:hypothetical protein L1987_24247 [Smallanthus sonchifolius]